MSTFGLGSFSTSTSSYRRFHCNACVQAQQRADGSAQGQNVNSNSSCFYFKLGWVFSKRTIYLLTIVWLIFCQVFYEDLLAGDYREERFRTLAKKQGVQEAKVERAFKEKKALLQWCHLVINISFVPILISRLYYLYIGTWHVQVPPVAFTFLDVHSKKGLNEDMALLAGIVL